jgi:hypothetical protein
MRRHIDRVLGFRLQTSLVILFSLIALVTVGATALVTSKLIGDYLSDAQDRRVSRDMQLAEAFYEIKLEKISGTARRLASSQGVVTALPEASSGDAEAMRVLDESVENEIESQSVIASHFIVLVDGEGESVLGRTSRSAGQATPTSPGDWSTLPIVSAVLNEGTVLSATEVSRHHDRGHAEGGPRTFRSPRGYCGVDPHGRCARAVGGWRRAGRCDGGASLQQ